jgi:hypothetical protein
MSSDPDDLVDLEINGMTFRGLSPEDAARIRATMGEAAKPEAADDSGNVEIDGHTYTLQSGTADQIERMKANGTFSGFGRVTPLPTEGPRFGFDRAKVTGGREWLEPSDTAKPIRAYVRPDWMEDD